MVGSGDIMVFIVGTISYTVNWIQILDVDVCISYSSNLLGKGMNLVILTLTDWAL